MSYFINVGSTYVTQYGYSYADTFNMLLDSLIDNAVLTQYATLYLIGEKSKTEPNALETFKSKTTEVEKYKYLLDDDDVEYATYKLYSSLNSAIDSYEKKVIEEEDGYTGTDKRTTPTNLDAEQDDYYPVKDGKLDYNVYTGFEGYLIGQSGKYQEDKLDGTTRVTRIKAYNAFLDNLRANDLIGDGESEVLTDVLKLGYIQSEFVSQLESRVVNKYYELYEEQRETLLTDNNYEYTADVYGKMLGDQKKSYKTSSAFDTAMGSMSSTSFILYNPKTDESDWADYDGKNLAKFGYVYNILLPYNAKQSAQLAELTKIKEANKDDNSYYIERNNLLRNIKTEDQRSAWFNGEKNYSFNAKASIQPTITARTAAEIISSSRDTLPTARRAEDTKSFKPTTEDIHTTVASTRTTTEATRLSATSLRLTECLKNSRHILTMCSAAITLNSTINTLPSKATRRTITKPTSTKTRTKRKSIIPNSFTLRARSTSASSKSPI